MPIGKADGNKFTVNIGRIASANNFKRAVAKKNFKAAAPHFRRMVMTATVRRVAAERNPMKALSGDPIIQMLNDPDWKPREVASLLSEVAKQREGGITATVNTLCALDQLNHMKVDQILKELGKINEQTARMIEDRVVNYSALLQML